MTAEAAAGKAGKESARKNGGSGAENQGGNAKSGAPKLTPEALKKIAEMRDRLQGLIGQVVMALSVVPRYRHQTLADLHHLVVEPLMRDRIAIASAAPRGEGEKQGEVNPALEQLAGIAFWASVSDAVDAKIKEQIKAGAFPIRLKPEEWASGETVWLIDVIAPSQKLATAVLANFSKVLPKLGGEGSGQAPVREQGDPALGAAPSEAAARSANSGRETNQVRIHPIVTRQIDPELLKKMGAVAEGA